MIKFARVLFTLEGHKEYTLSIDQIFEEKNSANSITPKDAKDFKEGMHYYIWWSECSSKDCSPSKKCCSFYKGLIKSLGG